MDSKLEFCRDPEELHTISIWARVASSRGPSGRAAMMVARATVLQLVQASGRQLVQISVLKLEKQAALLCLTFGPRKGSSWEVLGAESMRKEASEAAESSARTKMR